jgi:uncharacterized protein (DUF924 family)
MSKWFGKSSAAHDEEVATLFKPTVLAAKNGELQHWMESPEDALALIITLDQFPRHIWRGTGDAFSCDPLAVSLSALAVDRGYAEALPCTAHRLFLLLPFMHTEDLALQNKGVALFAALAKDDGPQGGLGRGGHDMAIKHRDVVARFGRFPHRNEALGRASTAEEVEFLKQPGSSF